MRAASRTIPLCSRLRSDAGKNKIVAAGASARGLSARRARELGRLLTGRAEVVDDPRRIADRHAVGRQRSRHDCVSSNPGAFADVGDHSALAHYSDVVADPDRPQVVSLRADRQLDVAEAVAAVDDQRSLREHAAGPDLNSGGALDHDVIGERAATANRDSGSGAPELGSKPPTELDARPDDERGDARHVEAESG